MKKQREVRMWKVVCKNCAKTRYYDHIDEFSQTSCWECQAHDPDGIVMYSMITLTEHRGD